MTINVGQLLEIEFVKEHAQLIAGRSGLGKVVSFVTIMEAPDFYEWVTGGEFVLTTWYAYSQHPELGIHGFTEMAKRGVAAIGIKMNRFISEVPPEIVAIANQYSLPLFAIRRETKFREMIQAIAAEINNAQVNLLLEIDRHYRELAKAALTGSDFETLMSGLGKRMRTPILCVDGQGRILGRWCPAGQAFNETAAAAALTEHRQNGEILGYTHFDSFHVFPCIAREQPLGFLVIAGSADLSERFSLMANQLATFLALKLLDRLETQEKLLAKLWEDLLARPPLSEAELRGRLARFGITRGLYRAIVIIARDREALPEHESSLRRAGAEICGYLSEAVAIFRPAETIVLAGGQIPDSPSSGAKWQKKLALPPGIVAGFGPAVANVSDLAESGAIARRTAWSAAKLGSNSAAKYLDYLAPNLLHESDLPERSILLARIISRLEDHDARHGGNLLATLRAVAVTDSLEEAATLLHVHVNTVRYRLGKIYELTGQDFFSARGRYALTTAVYAELLRR